MAKLKAVSFYQLAATLKAKAVQGAGSVLLNLFQMFSRAIAFMVCKTIVAKTAAGGKDKRVSGGFSSNGSRGKG